MLLNTSVLHTGASSSDGDAAGAIGLVRRVIAAATAGVAGSTRHAAGLLVARRHDGSAVGDCRHNC
eukprot:365907-Chlamydomonas_euryale.AAC.1